jgi:mRNA interferase RelE/StbE
MVHSSTVRYELSITEEARRQLRELASEIRRNIGFRLQLLQDDLAGDVKKLEGQGSHYRLRVGTYRILFIINGGNIEVYTVKPRKNVYE